MNARMARLAIADQMLTGSRLAVAITVFAAQTTRAQGADVHVTALAGGKALFATGLFKDVRFQAEGDVLVVIVEERPAIAEVKLD